MNKLLILIMLQLGVTSLNAQNFKFGKVSKEELQERFNSVDSIANATVLYSSEKVSYDYSVDKGFVVSREIHRRVKVYSKEGGKWANHTVKLYDKTRSLEEEISGLKAFTYNIENGKIVKSKLTKNGIFEEKKNEYWKYIKYTMPKVKAGSIIEYKYVIDSPFASRLDDVYLQEEIPIKKIELKVKVPDYFSFRVHHNIKSLLNPKIENIFKNRELTISWRGKPGQSSMMTKKEETLVFKESVYTYNGVNVPAIHEEPFLSNLNDYKSKLSFELLFTKAFNGQLTSYATNWDSVVDAVYKSEDFGNQLEKRNYFEKDIDQLLQSLTSKYDKVYAIYNYVKSRVKWNNFVGVYTLNGVKKAYKEGVGNVADINLMLTSMLRYAEVDANPILVSTKANGVPLYPTRQGFNYVICGVEINNEVLLLDASDKNTTINIVPEKVLNWQGRIIRSHGSSTWVDLFPNKNSINRTMIFAKLDDNLVFKGKVRNQKTDYYAYNYRNEYAGVVNNDIVKNISKDKGDVEVTNLKIKSDQQLEKPIQHTYDFVYEDGIEVIGTDVYVSPMLFLTEENNVFSKETRKYPIDFNFPRTNKNVINISIPEGYKIKSIPESVKLVMTDNLGEYSFIVRQKGNTVQISEIFKVNLPLISVVYYSELKEVYKKLVEKNSEKIILEKI